MVNVSSKNNEISINISTAGNKSNIKLDTPQNYYENLAKHWAVSEKLVNGEDYSSKHYANESKQQAILAKEKANIAVVKAQEVLDNSNKALSNISSQEEASKSSIKTEGESQIANIQANGNTQINNIKKQGNESVTSVNSAGATQVNLAKAEVAKATEQAKIATNKANEVINSGNNALSKISTQETSSKNAVKTEGESQIANIQASGNTQINNIKKQGNESVTSVNSAGATQVNLAKAEVAKATEQAKIATNKANEVINSGNNALSKISSQETSSKNAVKAEGDTQVTRLNTAGANYATKAEAKYTAGTGISITNNIITNTQADTSWNPPLLTSFWTDHLLNRMDMLRSDTFSWHNGTTYSNGYNELLSEYNNSASTTKTDTVGSVTITYKLTQKGYKICAANQVTSLTTLYNNTGIAWYYVLDTANKQFKLPRTKWGFKGLRDNVGNTIAESLPNITGDLYLLTDANGVYVDNKLFELNKSNTHKKQTLYSSANTAGNFRFNASLSSSTYQDNAPVQERATQMYLYFYVGKFTQTAIEQTAGLNAELFNNKMDRDMGNRASNIHFVTQTYQNGTSGYRIWSDGYSEQWGDLAANVTNLTFLKPFANTDYTFTIYFDNGNDQYAYVSFKYYLTSKTKTGITKNAAGNPLHWKACGYIK